MPRIDNWAIVYAPISPYHAPELHAQRLTGHVVGSDHFTDGMHITTSSIVATKDGKVITKSGSEYELGTIDPIYEKMYPNARKRLIESLPGVKHD